MPDARAAKPTCRGDFNSEVHHELHPSEPKRALPNSMPAAPGRTHRGRGQRGLPRPGAGFDLPPLMFAQGEAMSAACGHFVHVYVGRDDRRPRALPDRLRQALQPLCVAR